MRVRNVWLVAAAVCIAIVVAVILYSAKANESFVTRQDTVDYAKSVFNPLSVTTDMRKPNFAGTDDPTEIANVNRRIADATRSPLMLPGTGDVPVNADGSGTGLGAVAVPSQLQIPANNIAMAKARLCAEVTSCAMLSDPKYKECGFCVKGGTDVAGKRPGSYTGGLYISASDKADFDAAGKPYLPSFGRCAPRSDGTTMFYTAVAPCTKESNRQLCREVGGFGAPNASKCAFAQPGNTFVYQDPPNPTFSMTLRVAGPAGSRTTVDVRTPEWTSIGTGEAKNGDAVVTLSNMTEGQQVFIVFNQYDTNRRGIAAQWEGGTNLKVPLDRTLLGLKIAADPGTLGKDTPVMGLARRLRKSGSIGAGTDLRATMTYIMSSAMWVWGPNAGNFQFVVQCFVPGLFQDTTYAEDKFLQGNQPLIGKASTASMAEVGACNKPGQAPGSYSVDCLMDLFTSSGGDPVKGGLVKTGLNALNKRGSSDSIASYLGDLYVQATTGKYSNGGAVSVDDINQASQAMFGFDVASPCENIVQSNDGTMGFAAKSAPLDPSCLNYLWTNTGNERSRGNEDTSRSSLLQNTYTSIQDRYSGLMNGEASPARQSQYPFRTCQSSGTKAPVLASGVPNWDAITSVQTLNVGAVQDYYNNIYKTANYTTGNGIDNNTKLQQDALQQCYGVKKVPDAKCPA